MGTFHFLRPFWLLLILLLFILAAGLRHLRQQTMDWPAICDRPLLNYLLVDREQKQQRSSILFLFISAFFMIIALAGPTWERLPVPTYNTVQPRVILLSLADNMLDDDLKPNRLTRAKFIIHDLLVQQKSGQTGMIVYTSSAFVLAPLTEDGKTIDALLTAVQPDVVPVTGNDLAAALQQAQRLIRQAGFAGGQILVITASPPDDNAILTARKLASESIDTSVLPMIADQSLLPLFQPLAKTGAGETIAVNDAAQIIPAWLSRTSNSQQHYILNQQQLIPLWRDEGRWFLLPALLFLLPVFRRNGLQRFAL